MAHDRQQLLATLNMIQMVLAEIDRGAGFCEDRGFGWTLDNERRAGIGNVHAAFETVPELSALLPELAALTRDRERVIGMLTIPRDELEKAIRKVKREVRDQAQA